MNIFFVRHAKSENYDFNKRQGPDSQLGKTGKKQARLVANRLAKIAKNGSGNFDMILTSPWVRATETAEIIAKKTGLKLDEHPLIHEYLSNKILTNQPMDSDIVKEFNDAVKNKGVNFDWKFRGEGECMRDVINRAIKFKNKLLSNHLGKNYVVVSHGLFITTFVTLLILGDNYDDSQFKTISELIRLENTSLTHLEYDEDSNRWKIKCLNDFSHLEKLPYGNK
jgi:probable phosphoglycerate mutase